MPLASPTTHAASIPPRTAVPPAPRPAAPAAATTDALLLEELRTCLPLLPVLAGQLKEVAGHIESAVVQVAGSFQAMAQRAREAASQTPLSDAGTAGRTAGGGLEGLIATTRQTMGALLEQIEQTSSLSHATVEQMESMEAQIDGLSKTLHEIDAVACNARVLALNGQLEAARAGTQGAAFAVVATETAKMADHAMTSSRTIRTRIDDVAATIGGAAENLRQRAANDTTAAARSRDEVTRAFDRMAGLLAEMEQTMARSRTNSDQLARDIACAVVALQFQDTVGQRIGHVVNSIEELHGLLAARLAAPGSSEGPRAAEWARHMAQRYTMESERQVLAGPGKAAGRGAAPQCDVELF